MIERLVFGIHRLCRRCRGRGTVGVCEKVGYGAHTGWRTVQVDCRLCGGAGVVTA